MNSLYKILAIGSVSATLNIMAPSTSLGDGGPIKRSELVVDLRTLVNSDPVSDFATAKAKGDVAFLGMKGYAITVPGVPDYDEKYAKFAGVKVIRGTTDAIKTDGQRRIQDAVQNYAERYNHLVLDYLSTHKKRR